MWRPQLVQPAACSVLWMHRCSTVRVPCCSSCQRSYGNRRAWIWRGASILKSRHGSRSMITHWEIHWSQRKLTATVIRSVCCQMMRLGQSEDDKLHHSRKMDILSTCGPPWCKGSTVSMQRRERSCKPCCLMVLMHGARPHKGK